MMTDKWDEQLRCPQCRKTGMASFHQGEDDDAPTVDDVPEGFSATNTEFGPRFICSACGIDVEL